MKGWHFSKRVLKREVFKNPLTALSRLEKDFREKKLMKKKGNRGTTGLSGQRIHVTQEGQMGP